MHLTDILTPERIKIPINARTKAGIIEELVDVLAANGDIQDRDSVLHAVLAREKARTTGVGNGLAFPHGKCAGTRELIMAIGRATEPVDFGSVDGKPVTLIVLLVSPLDKTGPHIQALARISQLMTNSAFRRRLEHAPTAQQLYEAIEDQEKTLR